MPRPAPAHTQLAEMQQRFDAYPTPAQEALLGPTGDRRPQPGDSQAMSNAREEAYIRIAAMDDEEDFPPQEYGPSFLRQTSLGRGGIFPNWSPEGQLSYQPPRHEHRVIQVVDPLAVERRLAVLVGVVKTDNISLESFNAYGGPKHLDNISNLDTDVLVIAIITESENKLAFIRNDNLGFVQPFNAQHPQRDGTTFYYKWGWRAHQKQHNVVDEDYIRRFMQVRIDGGWEPALWVEGQ